MPWSCPGTRSTSGAQAIGVLGFMLERLRKGNLKHPLSARQAALARREILAAARDRDFLMRSTAVQALGVGGELVDVPLLRRIATSDPTCAEAPRSMNICWLARQAI